MVQASTSVTDALEAAFADAVSVNNYCSVGKAIKEHEAGEVIKAKVDDVATYSSATISRVLKAFGLTIASNTINQHRKHACRCK